MIQDFYKDSVELFPAIYQRFDPRTGKRHKIKVYFDGKRPEQEYIYLGDQIEHKGKTFYLLEYRMYDEIYNKDYQPVLHFIEQLYKDLR